MSFIPLHLLSSSPSFSLPLALSHLQLNTAGFQHQKAQLGMQLVFQASRLGALRLPAMCGGFFVVVFFFFALFFLAHYYSCHSSNNSTAVCIMVLRQEENVRICITDGLLHLLSQKCFFYAMTCDVDISVSKMVVAFTSDKT